MHSRTFSYSNIFAALLTVPAWVVGVGLCFHTSFDPDLFGKYDWRYFGFLAFWFLVVVPASYLLGRFLFGTQTIRLSGGRTVLVRPRTKITWLLAVGVPLLFITGAMVENRFKKRTATVHADTFHPFLQNVPKAGREKYHVNGWGFRGDRISRRKPPDTYRIFMFGGSTVFCANIPFEDSHCRLLEKRLRETYPEITIEVQNAGGDWHSSAHSLHKLLTWVQDFDPDLVIIYHGINDLLRSLEPDAFSRGKYRADYGHYYGAVANYVDPGASLRYIFDMYLGYWFSDFRMDRVRVLGPEGEGINGRTILFFRKSEPVEIDRWKSLPAFKRNMRDFVAIARSKGIDVIVASQPSLYREDLAGLEREVIWFPQTHHFDGKRASIASMVKGMARFNAAAEEIARELDAPFVDLERRLPKTLEYFYDDVHYTRQGNREVAEAFHEAIVQSGLIDSEAQSTGGDDPPG